MRQLLEQHEDHKLIDCGTHRPLTCAFVKDKDCSYDCAACGIEYDTLYCNRGEKEFIIGQLKE